MSLEGKVALVTGSTSGIGHAVADALAAQGAAVIINGLEEPSEGEAIARALAERHAVRTLFDGADLSRPEAVRRLVGRCDDELGGVDILVNNAGMQYTAPVQEFPAEKWDLILSLNLSAAFHAIAAAIPHMQRRGWGRIINTASAHGLVASVNKAAYVSAKHGLVGLTKVVALENADRGITCNAICPGWVETPLIQAQVDRIAQEQSLSQDDAKVELVRHKQPSRRFVQPEQIGALAAFLCSEAAGQITGAALPIDGGWTAQ